MRSAQRKRSTLVALGAALVLTGGARAEPLVDQQQPNADFARYVDISPRQSVAQGVTSGVAGFLAEVRLPVLCGDGASVTLEIREGPLIPGPGPSDVVLASASVAPGSDPAGSPGTFSRITFAAPPFIARGDVFTILLRSATGCGLASGPLGDVYAGGDGFFSSDSNGFRWICICADRERYDFPFQTLVEAACLVPNVRGKSLLAAQKALRENGCSARVTRKYSHARKGRVIGQTPAKGARLAGGAAVRLTVSRGPKPKRPHP